MKTQQELLDYLIKMVEWKRNNMPALKNFKYAGMDDYLLQHGRFYTIGPKPKGIPWGIPRNCFHNALTLTKRKGIGYVEGYAISTAIPYFPFHHGWNVKDGMAFDNTWRTPGELYYGVEFDPKVVREMFKTGGPMLDNWAAGYPLFREAA